MEYNSPDLNKIIVNPGKVKEWKVSEIGYNYVNIKVGFTNVSEVSVGGIEYQDSLKVKVINPDMFSFEEIDIPPNNGVQFLLT